MVFARRNAGKPSFSEKPTKTELDAKRKQYVAAKDLAARTLKPHGLDALIGKPVMAPDTQKSLDAALDKTDNVVLGDSEGPVEAHDPAVLTMCVGGVGISCRPGPGDLAAPQPESSVGLAPDSLIDLIVFG